MLTRAFLSGVLCLAPSLFARDGSDGPEKPLNVVLVLVDDLGWTDLGCQGSRFYETPHIDRLASQGMRFTNAYAACAVCSPTRAAVLTGRWPARLGVTDWIRARFQRGGRGTPAKNPTQYVGSPRNKLLCPPNPFWLERSEKTIAEFLGEHGYVSCHIGKWHLGDEAWYPKRQGFDENIGGCDYGQPPSYFDPYRNRRLTGIPTLAPRRKGEYLTDREASEAVGFIERNKDRPFFLFYAPYAVHTPIQAKPALTKRYSAKEKTTKQKNARYAAMVHSVDDAMGRIAKALDGNGLRDRTIVIFTSDNGGLIGPTDNSPLRSGKGFPYEGGIRVPLIVRWPGQVEAGRVSDAPVTSVDYLPTILEAAGCESTGKLDGVSLVEHLRSNGEQPLARNAVFWHFPHYRGRVHPYSIVRSGRFKLIKRYEGPTFELFDLADDPRERVDRSAAMPEQVEKLDRLLTRHLESVGAKLPRPNPNYGKFPPPPGFRPELPSVLLLGDSISMAYTRPVRKAFAGAANVLRPGNGRGAFENCEGTTKGVRALDLWLKIAGAKWDVIHFNFGLHDLKRVDPDTRRNSNDPKHPNQAPIEVYEKQLRQIVARLEKTGAKLIFATTTPVPEGGVRPHRDVADPARYNAVAKRIMKERGIPVNDLYAFALPRLAELQRRVDVHFTKDGTAALAKEVVRHVRQALPRR